MSSPPASKRRRSRRNSSERNAETLTTTTTTTLRTTRKDDVLRRASRHSKRARRSRSPVSWQDENSVTSSTTLNTAFIDCDTVADTDLKWKPDISAILPDDVIRRDTGSACRKSEMLAVARQMSLCERKFVDDVSDVVYRLLRPLLRRHDIVTSRQHAELFQNLEKVCRKILLM